MSSTERKEILGMSYAEISIIVILLCVGCVIAGILGRSVISRNPPVASPTQGANVTALPTEDNRVYSLELLAMNDTREYDYITVEGQVRNISGASLENVTAVIEFLDGNGNFVKSENALITYNPILSGQTSPFTVIGTDNPAIKRYNVTFQFLFGGTITLKDSR